MLKLSEKGEWINHSPFSMFAPIRCKAMPLRSRISRSRRDTVKLGLRTFTGVSASDERDTAPIEVTEGDVVRDQTLTSRDLNRRSVIDDVALIVRVVRQFLEEVVETSANIVVRQVAKLVDQQCLK